MDKWKETWDWAHNLWGSPDDFTFNTFFRGVASVVARNRGWEELGSSDVWHASYSAVEYAKKTGKVATRDELKKFVLDYQCIGEWEL
jgi:hypothetical protein